MGTPRRGWGLFGKVTTLPSLRPETEYGSVTQLYTGTRHTHGRARSTLISLVGSLPNGDRAVLVNSSPSAACSPGATEVSSGLQTVSGLGQGLSTLAA